MKYKISDGYTYELLSNEIDKNILLPLMDLNVE